MHCIPSKILSIGILTISGATLASAESSFNSTPSLPITMATKSISSHSNQSQPKTLTLAQASLLVAQYQQNQFDDAILKAQHDVLQANISQTKKWSNPSLEFSTIGLSAKQREMTLALSQPVDVFGTKTAQRTIAKQRLTLSTLEYELYQARRMVAIQALYNRVFQAQQKLNVSASMLNLQQQMMDTATRCLRAGRISQVELERVSLKLSQQKIEHQSIKANFELVKSQLSRLWGGNSSNFKQVAPLQFSTDLNKSSDVLPSNPLFAVMDQETMLSNSQLNLLNRQNKPMPTVMLGMRRLQSNDQLTSENTNQIVLGVSMALPVFGVNRTASVAVESRKTLLSQQKALMTTQLEARQTTLLAQLKLNQSQVNTLENEQLPTAQSIYQKMMIGFEAGKFSLFEVHQVQQELLAVQDALLTAQNEQSNLQLSIDGLKAGFEAETDLTSTSLADSLLSDFITSTLNSTNTFGEVTP